MSDVVNNRLDIWQKNKRFISYGSLYKKKNNNLNGYRSLSLTLLIFRITLDLILKDIIQYNYVFKLPHINGGFIGIFNISRPRHKFRVKHGHSAYCRPVLQEFCRYKYDRHQYGIRFRGEYLKMFKKKINNGYIYQRYNGN